MEEYTSAGPCGAPLAPWAVDQIAHLSELSASPCATSYSVRVRHRENGDRRIFPCDCIGYRCDEHGAVNLAKSQDHLRSVAPEVVAVGFCARRDWRRVRDRFPNRRAIALGEVVYFVAEPADQGIEQNASPTTYANRSNELGDAFCSIDGCDNVVLARRLCAMHYRRLKRTGDPLKRRRPGRKAPEPDLQLHLATLASVVAFEHALVDLHQIDKVYHHGTWSIPEVQRASKRVWQRETRGPSLVLGVSAALAGGRRVGSGWLINSAPPVDIDLADATAIYRRCPVCGDEDPIALREVVVRDRVTYHSTCARVDLVKLTATLLEDDIDIDRQLLASA